MKRVVDLQCSLKSLKHLKRKHGRQSIAAGGLLLKGLRLLLPYDKIKFIIVTT